MGKVFRGQRSVASQINELPVTLTRNTKVDPVGSVMTPGEGKILLACNTPGHQTSGMALFGRREIQRRIDELALTISSTQLEAIVRRLNMTDRDALRTEWEIAWLAALSRIGTIRHEALFPGSTSIPDIHFSNAKIEFIADVTAVSDQGYDEQNPVNELRRCLDEHKTKYGLVSGGFSLTFSSRIEKIGKRSAPRVILPPHAEIAEFVRRHFDGYLREISAHPDVPKATEAIVRNGDKVRLEYNPKRRPGSTEGGHLCYDLPYSLCDNPVYRGLKQKRSQLAGCSFVGLRGIILCDADCAALGRYPQVRSTEGYGVNAIVAEFFRQHSSIAFVITAGVRSNVAHVYGRGSLPLDLRLHFHPQTQTIDQHLIRDIFVASGNDLPSALWTPENALTMLRAGSPPPLKSPFTDWKLFRISHSMNPAISSTEVSLPVRTLLSILTGELSPKELDKKAVRDGHGPTQIIAEALHGGQALESMQMKKGDKDADDDMITFTFRGHDAGRSKFRTTPHPKA